MLKHFSVKLTVYLFAAIFLFAICVVIGLGFVRVNEAGQAVDIVTDTNTVLLGSAILSAILAVPIALVIGGRLGKYQGDPP